ncbi:MAG: nitrilase-related carbon-nitrogen hydrolase, partial [Verrucomicrobiota bacterium]
MKIALAQINTTIGDLVGNEAKIAAAYARAVEAKVDVVVFPELSTTGYPPRDLLLKKEFVAKNLSMLDRLAAATQDVAMLVGYVGENKSGPGRETTNGIALLRNGRIVATRAKTLLPTYDVFDEDRYFEPAQKNLPVEVDGRNWGLTICEDIWNDEDFWQQRRYRRDPVADLLEAGVDVIFNISASPWHVGKERIRHSMLATVASQGRRPVVFCNAVGGNDELVFDGNSCVFSGAGELIAKGKAF